jgi:hypothetical protein
VNALERWPCVSFFVTVVLPCPFMNSHALVPDHEAKDKVALSKGQLKGVDRALTAKPCVIQAGRGQGRESPFRRSASWPSCMTGSGCPARIDQPSIIIKNKER